MYWIIVTCSNSPNTLHVGEPSIWDRKEPNPFFQLSKKSRKYSEVFPIYPKFILNQKLSWCQQLNLLLLWYVQFQNHL